MEKIIQIQELNIQTYQNTEHFIFREIKVHSQLPKMIIEFSLFFYSMIEWFRNCRLSNCNTKMNENQISSILVKIRIVTSIVTAITFCIPWYDLSLDTNLMFSSQSLFVVQQMTISLQH